MTKRIRNLVGAALMAVYFLAGGATIEASVNCNDTVYCHDGHWQYEKTCTFQGESASCDDIWWTTNNSVCDGYPYYGWISSFSCQESDWQPICDYFPGYCTGTSGTIVCTNYGGPCTG